jgi:hypothetical protein
MKKTTGITEMYWSSLSEDKRFYWKLFTRIVVIPSSFFLVSKTDIAIFDWILAAVAGLLTMGIIEPQRTYSRFTPVLRKRITRIVVVLSRWSIAVLGIAFFAQVGVGVLAKTAQSELSPILHSKLPYIIKFLCIGMVFLVGFFAILKSLRDLHYEEMIYEAPNRGLKQLLIYRSFIVNNSYEFQTFELGVFFAGLLYCSAVASIVKAFALLLI